MSNQNFKTFTDIFPGGKLMENKFNLVFDSADINVELGFPRCTTSTYSSILNICKINSTILCQPQKNNLFL